MKNRVWVLIAHGSRLDAANREVIELAEQFSAKLKQPVFGCFLEIAEPDIPTALDQALKKNPSEIIVLPYFLTQGRHVKEDIPRLVAEKARAFPETPIRLLEYVGASPGMLELLEKLGNS